MASTKLNRGRRLGVCQFAHCRTQGLTNHQTQFVAEFRVFSIVRHRNTIEDNCQKITIKTVKTNNSRGLTTPKSRPADREILRDTATFCGPNRRHWSTATIVAPGRFSEGAREGLLLALLGRWEIVQLESARGAKRAFAARYHWQRQPEFQCKALYAAMSPPAASSLAAANFGLCAR
jgi:hypothetical protein